MKAIRIATLAGLVASSASADPLLVGFAGDWNGRGFAATSADKPMEPVRCKMTAEPPADASVLIQGRCAVAAGSAQLFIKILHDGAGQLRAAFASNGLVDLVQFVGTAADGRFELSSIEGYLLDEVAFDVRSVIEITGEDSFTLKDWNTAAGTDDWRLVTDITFARIEDGQ